MNLSLISAVSLNGVIGRSGGIPWHLPEDFKHFKALTIGKPCIMGRATFDSIGKPLPNRPNIVLTRNTAFTGQGIEVFNDLKSALQAYHDAPEIMIIGGAHLYQEAMPLANRLYITQVQAEILDGDTFFPAIDFQQWAEVERIDRSADEKNCYPYSFIEYKRVLA